MRRSHDLPDRVTSQRISNDEILDGLASIAQDPSNPAAARVSAYRTLADIRGMSGMQQELPPGLTVLLAAIGRGAEQKPRGR